MLNFHSMNEVKFEANSESEIKSPSKETNFKDELLYYGKLFIILSVLFSSFWIFGYLQINILWGIIGILTYIIYQRTINRQRQKFNFGLSISNDLKYTLENVSNLPSWVSFPDVERAEWINKTILRLWPNINKFLNVMIEETVLRKIKKSLSGLKLKEIYFGDIPPKIGGIKIYDNENISREEIIMDVEIYYYSPAKITFIYNQIPFGIKSFEMKAQLRVQMNSLIPKIPFFGSISFTLLQNPHINFEFTDVVAIFNMPGLRSLLRETVDDLIASIIVLPNRINFILHKDTDKNQFLYHIPDGVIRINVIEAASLKAMDVRIFESNTSDPYIILRVGAEKFKTKVIHSSLNPKWNETFEAIVDSKSCQKVELEIYDKDKNNKDDFLGRVSFDVEGVFERGIFDTWLQLEEVTTGSVHLNLTWLNLSADPGSFDLEEDRIKTTETQYNVGFLYLSMDSAKNLCKSSSNEDPDPYVKITLGNQVVSSSARKKTINPIWEKQFHFLIQSLLSSVLNFQIKDEKSKKVLGNCSFKVDKLLNEPNMQGFFTLKLENTNSTGSTIQFYVMLRALLPKKTRSSTFSRGASIRLSNYDSKIMENKVDVNSNEKIVESDNVDEVFEVPKESVPDSCDAISSSIEKQSPTLSDGSPKVYMTLRYTANRNMFIAAIHKVQNLKTNRDIFVKLSMLPKDSRNGKRHTKPIRNQKTVIFDETFEFFSSKEVLLSSELVLNFKIDRHSVLKRNNKIGITKIHLSEFDPNAIKSEWFLIDTHKYNRSSDTLSILSNQSDATAKESKD